MRLSGWKSVAPSKLSRTEVESVMSAEPGDEPGDLLADRVLDLVRRLAGRHRPVVGVEARDLGVPAVGQLAALHLVDLAGELGLVGGVGLELRLPRGAGVVAAGADALGEALLDAVGDQELGVLGPAVGGLRLAHLVLAERLAVRRGGVLLVRRAPADVAVDDDQRRPALLGLEALERAGDEAEVVGVADPLHVPAIAHEARGDVVVVGDLGVAVDRDVVVVVDPAEVVELLVAGERGGLVRDALHQAAVAGDRVHVEVEERRVRAG